MTDPNPALHLVFMVASLSPMWRRSGAGVDIGGHFAPSVTSSGDRVHHVFIGGALAFCGQVASEPHVQRGWKSRRIRAGWGAVTGGVLIGLFWLGFAATGAGADAGEAIATFESAFPIADALLAATLIAAGVALLRDSAAGPFLLVVAGGALLFLAVLDMTYFVRHGLYLPFTSPSVLEVLVNGLCLGGGMYFLRFGWSAFQRTGQDEP
jgi:hypothetical protein